MTPLTSAAGEGHTSTVRLLLDAKADVNRASNVRYFPHINADSYRYC
jgi:ankyrin repeat protein